MKRIHNGVEWVKSVTGHWHLSRYRCKGQNDAIRIVAVKVSNRPPEGVCKRCLNGFIRSKTA